MTLIKRLEAACAETKSGNEAVGVMLTRDDLVTLIKAAKLSEAVWLISKS